MAFYRTGTISLTNGSNAVTGVGTDFYNGAAVGETIQAPDGKLYEILSIQSATALTLGQPYLGATASGQAYSIIPTQSYIRDLASQAATLVNGYQAVKDEVGSGKFTDGTQTVPGIRFTSDDDTGVRRVGANSLALVAGGVDQATVSASGVNLKTGSTLNAVALADVATAQTLTNKTLNLTSNTLVATSAQLKAALTDETGSGAAVFATSPTLVTPVLGVATATSVNKLTLTAPATSATLTLAQGSTLATAGAFNQTLTATATTNVTLPTTGTLATLAGTETLTNKTLTTPIINGPVLGTFGDIAARAPIQPTLDLDFANQRYRVFDGATGLKEIALADLMTYTGSGRTYTDALGILRAQATNTPRLEFDPVTGVGNGLSVWEARTNLALDSGVITASVGTLATPNAATAPDGTLTADFIYNSTTSAEHYAGDRNIAVTAGVDYTWSVFVKAGPSANRKLYLRVANASTITVVFDPVLKTIQTASGNGVIGGDFQELQDGWFRVWIVFTAQTTRNLVCRLQLWTTTAIYQGDGTSGLYLWGAQLEAGTSASPYIPTTTAAVTAPADVASITGANFSKWFNQSEGTFVYIHESEIGASAGANVTRSFVVSDGTNYNRIIGYGHNLSTVSGGVVDGGVGSGTNYLGRVTRAVSYSPTALSFSMTGGAVVTDSTFTPISATLNTMVLGKNSPTGSGTELNGTLIRILYFPRALPASLQTLSA